jgi:hypothetical protein
MENFKLKHHVTESNVQKKESLAFHMAVFFFMCVMSLVGCNKMTTADSPLSNSPPPGGGGAIGPSCPSGYYDSSGNCTLTDPGSDTDTNTTGATTDFRISSFTEFNSYVATRPLNNPTNVKISVELQHVGDLRYGGRVALSYNDSNQYFQGWLESGLGRNESFNINSRDDGAYEAQYNYWFNYQGQTVFNGFFQDTIGAVVLVIDGSQNQGDGQGGGLVSGSLWYKNFAQVLASQGPMRKCWFITLGPYDCRSGTVLIKSNPYPSDGYKLLGTFSGLDMKKAFGL